MFVFLWLKWWIICKCHGCTTIPADTHAICFDHQGNLVWVAVFMLCEVSFFDRHPFSGTRGASVANCKNKLRSAKSTRNYIQEQRKASPKNLLPKHCRRTLIKVCEIFNTLRRIFVAQVSCITKNAKESRDKWLSALWCLRPTPQTTVIPSHRVHKNQLRNWLRLCDQIMQITPCRKQLRQNAVTGRQNHVRKRKSIAWSVRRVLFRNGQSLWIEHKHWQYSNSSKWP